MIIGVKAAELIINSSFGSGAFDSIMNSNISSQNSHNALWIFQLTATTLPLLISPVFFSYVVIGEPDTYLKTSFDFPWRLIIVVFLIMMLSVPAMEFIGNFNQNLNLPQWMRDEENKLEQASDSMLQMKTIWSMFFNVILIGLVTAIAEEFLFRG